MAETCSDTASIRIVQYNILADMYTVHLNNDHVEWKARRGLLEERLASIDGDILLLEEVQNGARLDEVQAMLERLGYGSHYQSKADRRGKARGGDTIGNLVAWRTAVFSAERRDRVVLPAEVAQLFPQDARARNYYAHQLQQCAAMVVLRRHSDGRRLLAVAAHLSSDWRAHARQVVQAYALASALARVVHALPGVPLVLGIDANFEPDQFGARMLRGEKGLDPATLGAKFALPPALAAPGGFDSPLPPLRSAYAEVHGHEAPVTNVGPDATPSGHGFIGSLDYIFLAGPIQAMSARALPTRAEILDALPLPSASEPSDHLPIVVTTQF